MATELLTTYIRERGIESVEVELDGEWFTEEFTDLKDLQIRLLFRGLDHQSIETILSDVYRGRSHGWVEHREPYAADEYGPLLARNDCLKYVIAALCVVIAGLVVRAGL